MTDLERIARAVADPQRLAAVSATGLLDTGPEEPFDRLARLAATTLAAPLAFVTVVDAQRSFWKACIGVDAHELADRQNAVEESFCQYVIGSGSELVVSDAASDPRTRDNPSVDLMGVAAWAGFPLRSPDGHVLGSFCVVDTSPRTWADHEIDILRSLADAAAGEVKLRAAAQRASTLARTLQATLLPPVTPQIPGFDVGAIYRAAGAGDEVMGDFYDIFESSGGRWNVVLGDVSGKGIDAAKLTGLARYTLRAAAMREPNPSRVLARLDEALKMDQATTGGRFVTAVMVALDAHEGGGVRATVSSGGHVPALLRTATGIRAISPPGGLLGVITDLTLADAEFDLDCGDVIVLYTDGVTEARDADGEQFGPQLPTVVATAPGDALAIARAIDEAVVEFAGPVGQDDVAIVVLRVV